MPARALAALLLALGAASPAAAGEAPPVEVELLEFLGEIEVSAADWAALADAESLAQPAEAAPAPGSPAGAKEGKDGKQ